MGETQCSKARAEVNRSGPELSPHEVTFHPAGCELEDIKEHKDINIKKEIKQLGSNPLCATGYPQLEVGTILSLTL